MAAVLKCVKLREGRDKFVRKQIFMQYQFLYRYPSPLPISETSPQPSQCDE